MSKNIQSVVDQAAKEFENSKEFQNELRRRNFAGLIMQAAQVATNAYTAELKTQEILKGGTHD